jgi:DNA-binding Lrp family transcriptional regulator
MPRMKTLRDLDHIDRQIVTLLARDGRMPNQAVADAVNIAASTAHHRIATLVGSGIIKGFHAEISPEAVGRPLTAAILLQVRAASRARLESEIERISGLPGVLRVSLLASLFDLLVIVAMPDPGALSDFVLHELSEHPEIASTQTCVIMSEYPGQRGLEFLNDR